MVAGGSFSRIPARPSTNYWQAAVVGGRLDPWERATKRCVFLLRKDHWLGIKVFGGADSVNSPQISTRQLARYSLLGLVAMGRGIVPVLQSETVISLPEVVYRPLADEEVPFSVIDSLKNHNPAVRTLLCLTKALARERGVTD